MVVDAETEQAKADESSPIDDEIESVHDAQ